MTDSHTSPTKQELPAGIEYTEVDRNLVGTTELKQRFGFHKATIEGPEATQPMHAELREAFLEFAEYLDGLLPAGREKEEVLTHLENSSMWSHKSISKTAPLEGV